MAKTLMYVPGSPTSVKLGDTDTDLYLQVAKDNVAVDLTAVKSITVKIADASHNFLKTINIDKTALNNADKGIVDFPLTIENLNGLPASTYYFEIWIVTADSDLEIYPDVDVANFTIINNIESGTTVYTSLTLQDFEDRFNELDKNAQTALTNANQAQEIATQASATATTASSDAEAALTSLQNGDYAKKTDTVAAADKLATARKINGTAFDGTSDISVKASNDSDLVHLDGTETVTGTKTFSSTVNGNISGNAATATKLKTPVQINGVSFDGSASINVLPADSGWLDATMLNSSTATKAQYRQIGNVVYVHVTNLKMGTTGTGHAMSIPLSISGEAPAEHDSSGYAYKDIVLMDVTNGVFSPLASVTAGEFLSFSFSAPIN